ELGQNPAEVSASVHDARSEPGGFAHAPRGREPLAGAPGGWRLAQALTSALLAGALAWAIAEWLKVRDRLPLTPMQRTGGWVLLVGGLLVFGSRSVVQLLRWSAARDRARGPD